MIVRPLSNVDNTRDYARVSHSRQWSNYNVSNTLKHSLWFFHLQVLKKQVQCTIFGEECM